MKVLIEARALSATAGGVKSYTLELIRNLVARKQHEYELLVSAPSAKKVVFEAQSHLVPLAHDFLLSHWLHTKVPKAVSHINPDVVHFTKADVPKKKAKPTVVTIYDIIPILFPESQSLFRRIYWPKALERAATQADHVLTISEQSKKDIMSRFNVDEQKITVTPLAINTGHFKPVTDEGLRSAVKNRYSLPEKYILFVGTRDRRKNSPALIEAFSRIHKEMDHHLVIVGRPAFKYDTTIDAITKSGVSEKIHVVENASYEDLPTIYSMADLFVWPSVYEGWGFPPQEAMACGVPVIVSNGGPLPEVVGNAGVIVPFTTDALQTRVIDKDFVMKLSEEMKRVIGDLDEQIKMKQAGLERVTEFSWTRVAEQTEKVYESLL